MPTRFLFEVLVNHQWVPVLLGRSGRQVVVELPGRHVTVDVVELSEATYSLLIDGRSYDVTVGVAEKEYQVSVNGSQFDVCLRDPRKFRNQTASEQRLCRSNACRGAHAGENREASRAGR